MGSYVTQTWSQLLVGEYYTVDIQFVYSVESIKDGDDINLNQVDVVVSDASGNDLVADYNAQLSYAASNSRYSGRVRYGFRATSEQHDLMIVGKSNMLGIRSVSLIRNESHFDSESGVVRVEEPERLLAFGLPMEAEIDGGWYLITRQLAPGEVAGAITKDTSDALRQEAAPRVSPFFRFVPKTHTPTQQSENQFVVTPMTLATSVVQFTDASWYKNEYSLPLELVVARAEEIKFDSHGKPLKRDTAPKTDVGDVMGEWITLVEFDPVTRVGTVLRGRGGAVTHQLDGSVFVVPRGSMSISDSAFTNNTIDAANVYAGVHLEDGTVVAVRDYWSPANSISRGLFEDNATENPNNILTHSPASVSSQLKNEPHNYPLIPDDEAPTDLSLEAIDAWLRERNINHPSISEAVTGYRDAMNLTYAGQAPSQFLLSGEVNGLTSLGYNYVMPGYLSDYQRMAGDLYVPLLEPKLVTQNDNSRFAGTSVPAGLRPEAPADTSKLSPLFDTQNLLDLLSSAKLSHPLSDKVEDQRIFIANLSELIKNPENFLAALRWRILELGNEKVRVESYAFDAVRNTWYLHVTRGVEGTYLESHPKDQVIGMPYDGIQSSLASKITSPTATTLTINPLPRMPLLKRYIIRVHNELMLVTNTVVREDGLWDLDVVRGIRQSSPTSQVAEGSRVWVFVDANGNPRATGDGEKVDVGAVESLHFYVDTTADGIDPLNGDGLARNVDGTRSIRTILNETRDYFGDVTIYVPEGVYHINGPTNGVDENSGDLDVFQHVLIVGDGPNKTILDAAAIDRLFEVHPGARLTLRNLTLRGGATAGDGGAILVSGGELILDRVIVENSTANRGGLIAVHDGGHAWTRWSTLTNGQSDSAGGAVFVMNGAFDSITSTFSGNHAGTSGGAIYADSTSTLQLFSSTIANNEAVNGAGGVANVGHGAYRNNIIATNHDLANQLPDFYGYGESFGHNLVGVEVVREVAIIGDVASNSLKLRFADTEDLPSAPFSMWIGMEQVRVTELVGDVATIQRGVNGQAPGSYADGTFVRFEPFRHSRDLTGTLAAPFDPMIGPLAYEDSLTPIHPVLKNSPALDVGYDPYISKDQRGFYRYYQFDSNGDGIIGVDIGAYERMPSFSILAIDSNKPEGTSQGRYKDYVFEVTRPVDDLPATVPYYVRGSGIHPADRYDFEDRLLPRGVVQFGPNEFSKRLVIRVASDEIQEFDEGFKVYIVPPSTSTNVDATEAEGLIVNDDRLFIQVGSTSLVETAGKTNTWQIPVRLKGGLQGEATVHFDIQHISTSAADFNATTGTLHFNGYADEVRYLTVNVKDDFIVERNEQFQLTVTSIEGLNSEQAGKVDTSGVGTIQTIVNDDVAYIYPVATTVTETDGLSYASISVRLTNDVSDPLSVKLSTTQDSAKLGLDYLDSVENLQFVGSKGEVRTFTLPIVGNDVTEPQEKLKAIVSNLIAPGFESFIHLASNWITIQDDDQAKLVMQSVTVNEDTNSTATFSVTLDNPTQDPFVVDVSTSFSGYDFERIQGKINFAGTLNETHSFTVPIHNDNYKEGIEDYAITAEPEWESTYFPVVPGVVAALTILANDSTSTVADPYKYPYFQDPSAATNGSGSTNNNSTGTTTTNTNTSNNYGQTTTGGSYGGSTGGSGYSYGGTNYGGTTTGGTTTGGSTTGGTTTGGTTTGGTTTGGTTTGGTTTGGTTTGGTTTGETTGSNTGSTAGNTPNATNEAWRIYRICVAMGFVQPVTSGSSTGSSSGSSYSGTYSGSYSGSGSYGSGSSSYGSGSTYGGTGTTSSGTPTGTGDGGRVYHDPQNDPLAAVRYACQTVMTSILAGLQQTGLNYSYSPAPYIPYETFYTYTPNNEQRPGWVNTEEEEFKEKYWPNFRGDSDEIYLGNSGGGSFESESPTTWQLVSLDPGQQDLRCTSSLSRTRTPTESSSHRSPRMKYRTMSRLLIPPRSILLPWSAKVWTDFLSSQVPSKANSDRLRSKMTGPSNMFRPPD